MSTASTWNGFTSDVLTWVAAYIEARKATYGLNLVRVGEQWRGWESPACFIWLSPEGITLLNASGRTGLNNYRVPVTVSVLTRNVEGSDDLAVLRILEKVLQDLDGALPTGTTKMGVVSPGKIVPLLNGANGSYDTVGTVQVEYMRGHEDSRRLG